MSVRNLAAVLPTPLLLIALLGSSARAEEKIAHTKDSLQTVKKYLNEGKALLFDVREQDEWDEGHLAQAKLVPLSKLKAVTDPKTLVADADAKKIIYCHCRAGRRALTAAETLKKLGFEVRPLKQGYEELLQGGLPKSK